MTRKAILPKKDLVTITGLLVPDEEQKKALRQVMRSQSSCKRMAHGRLLKEECLNDVRKYLKDIFPINARYVYDAIDDAQSNISSCKELGTNPKDTIFGGRKLFNRLKKKHLDASRLSELHKQFREQRQCNLYSRGEKSHKGNANIRFEESDDGMFFRINIGDRQWITVPFISNHKKLDKLRTAAQISLAYTCRIMTRDGKDHIHITVTEKFPAPVLGAGNFSKNDNYLDIPMKGPVFSLDRNAFPSCIAWTVVNSDGNIIAFGNIPTPELYDQRSDKRGYYAWKYAQQIVDLAKKHKAGIALEILRFVRGKKRKQESRSTRRKKSNFCYRKMFDKIVVLAMREQIFVKPVKAAYSTIIGTLKYGSLRNLSKHQAAAYVIGRRALGFFDELIPESLLKKTEDFLEKKRHSVPGNVRVTRWKKESYPISGHRWSTWEVVKQSVLTGHTTGWKKAWNRLNPSTLKALSFGEHGSEFVPDPVPGPGS